LRHKGKKKPYIYIEYIITSQPDTSTDSVPVHQADIHEPNV